MSEGDLLLTKEELATVTNKGVGIDLGVKSNLTLSVPVNIHLPENIKKKSRQLKRLARQLDRKEHPRTKGDSTKKSNNYLKAAARLSKLYILYCNIQ